MNTVIKIAIVIFFVVGFSAISSLWENTHYSFTQNRKRSEK